MHVRCIPNGLVIKKSAAAQLALIYAPRYRLRIMKPGGILAFVKPGLLDATHGYIFSFRKLICYHFSFIRRSIPTQKDVSELNKLSSIQEKITQFVPSKLIVVSCGPDT